LFIVVWFSDSLPDKVYPATMTAEKPEYYAQPVPGVLSVSANVRVIPSYPLVRQLNPMDKTGEPVPCPVKLNYIVSPQARSAGKIHGKSFEAVSNTALRLETPVGPFSRLSLLLDWNAANPVLTVNKAFHRLAKVTIGNVHSVGWLVRDLSNLALLANNYALLHTAAFKHKNKVILIFGLSNTGKTTTVFSQVKDHGAEFYGDDLVVTDGSKLYACPFTGANINPQDGPGLKYKIEQTLRRGLPFFENFAGTLSYSISDALGADNIAAPAAVTDIIIMRKAEQAKSEVIEAEHAAQLMLASNRTEFTFASSPLFSAAEYFETGLNTDAVMKNESVLLQQLAEQAVCHYACGDVHDLGNLVREILAHPD
tara:strand:+ start:309 stop:1412 length:1104 start_codon:yes stop_codon:yes gene_type:complete